jgi:ribose transport system ATP-binding protein
MQDPVKQDKTPYLRMHNISKSFPGVLALKDVSFELRKGEIHGIVGENGAGKSTLIKILGGAYLADSGTIEIAGESVHIHNPKDALNRNISIIYQEFNLVPTLSVAENIFLGKEIVSGLLRSMNRKKMRAESQSVIEKLGLKGLDCGKRVDSLSIAQQQLVEIGKALFNNAKILVMDEPTSVLSQNETAALFELMKGLVEKDISLVFISHRLEEVIDLCDRITVLRDGECVDTLDNSKCQVSKDDLIKKMVGRVLMNYFPEKKHVPTRERIIEVKGLTCSGMFEDINFELYGGEILGFYGLVGSGRTEIMKSIFGSLEYEEGNIYVRGKQLRISGTGHIRRSGLVLVPEDRKSEGLVLKHSIADNICLPNLDDINRLGTIISKMKKKLVNKYMEELSINPKLPNRLAKDFSGGNQQKAVIAKWLAAGPKIIIFDEPTRGIDVGAKAEIYHLIEELAKDGVAIIFVSSELMEILGMCDRVIVVHEGKITKVFSKEEATEELLVQAASGYTADSCDS